MAGATQRPRVGPPASLWVAVAVVAILRALPWLATIDAPPAAGSVLPPIGYNPKDWLVYVALIREAAAHGGLFLANPFTTDPQDGRYVLLLPWALGRFVALTGLDPFTVLELSRVPLLVLMLLALWRLTGVVLPDRRTRTVACWLVLLSGGLEAGVDGLAPYLPEAIRWPVHQDLWHLQGWNTFAAAYNPLWVAALALTFFTLVPLLRPAGPSGIGDAAILGGGLLALAATHPYSTLVVLAVAVTRPVLGWLVQVPRARAGVTTSLMGLLPALAVIIALAAWQNADAVYRATATGTLGPQALSVFWYPVTLGVTGVFAVRGWRTWLAEANPCALPMAAWTLAVIFLHTSTVLNGYHFVFHLYTPICVAAAPAMVRAWDGARGRPWGMVGAVAVGVLLVQAPLLLTRKCLTEVESHRINQTSARVLGVLATMPGGNVLAPADLGNFVPAYGPHRVYTGHWFLTPQYTERANQALAVATGRTGAAELIALVDAQHLDYLVVATQAAPALASALGARVARTIDAGELTLIILDGGQAGGR